MKNLFKSLFVLLIMTFTLTSCQSMDNISAPESSYTEDSSYKSQSSQNDMASMPSSIDSENESKIVSEDSNFNNERIERFYQITTQTDNYDEDFNKLNSLMKKDKGYLESSNLSVARDNNLNKLRNYYAVIKIPKDSSEDFLNEIQNIGKLDNLSNSSANLNQQYTNVEIRLKSKNTELDKLNELMEKSQNLEDTMAIQSRILEVQSEIDEIESQLRELDNRVTYDTFNINLIEVYRYGEYVNTNPNLIERLIEAFKNSIDIFINLIAEILVAIASLWPFILILVALGYFIIKKNKKINKH